MNALEQMIDQASAVNQGDEGDPIGTAEYVSAMLGTTLEFEGNRRVKMLPLEWARLTPAECIVALRTVHHAIAFDRREFPDAALHLEFGEVPPYLRDLMDEVTREEPQVTYAVVPGLAP